MIALALVRVLALDVPRRAGTVSPPAADAVAEGPALPQLPIQFRGRLDEDALDERRADEDRISGRVEDCPRRRDGTLRRDITIWVVRHDDSLYVQSVNGRRAAWFCGALATHEGRIRAGGVEKDVTFVEPDHDIGDALDAAYRSKYRRYPASIVDHIVSPWRDEPPWNSARSQQGNGWPATRSSFTTRSAAGSGAVPSDLPISNTSGLRGLNSEGVEPLGSQPSSTTFL